MFNLIVCLLCGLAIITTSVISLLKEKNRFHYFGNYKQNRFFNNLKRFIRLKVKGSTKFSKKEHFIAVVVGSLFAFTANSMLDVPKYFLLGILLGLLLISLSKKLKEKTFRAKKLKEISILFEAVELYTKAGYTVFHSLKSARVLTHAIRPSLDKCLEQWSRSPQKALEILQEELNLPESEILVLLLIHMEVVGAKEMQGVIKRETDNISRVQKMKSQIGISNRPLILMIYRILPLISILGIAVGSLLYRTYSALTTAGIF